MTLHFSWYNPELNLINFWNVKIVFGPNSAHEHHKLFLDRPWCAPKSMTQSGLNGQTSSSQQRWSDWMWSDFWSDLTSLSRSELVYNNQANPLFMESHERCLCRMFRCVAGLTRLGSACDIFACPKFMYFFLFLLNWSLDMLV